MTAIIGIWCKQGVVIGTDSSATFGQGNFYTVEQPTEKLSVIEGKVIIAGCGPVGLGQRFEEVVRGAYGRRDLTASPIDVVKGLSRKMLDDFQSTYAKLGQYGALIAFPAKGEAHLCEFGIADFQPELKKESLWYCSMGSTQPITDPFLGFVRDVFWQNGPPSLSGAIFAATWALEHAIQVNTGGVNGPARIATLNKTAEGNWKAEIIPTNVLDEHRQNIQGAKNVLRDYARKLEGVGTTTTIPIPKPQ